MITAFSICQQQQNWLSGSWGLSERASLPLCHSCDSLLHKQIPSVGGMHFGQLVVL